MHRFLVALLMTVTLCAWAENQDESANPGPSIATVTVQEGALAVAIESTGNLDAGQIRKLKLITEEVGGPFVITDIVPTGRMVDQGAAIVRFDPTPISRSIRSTKESIDVATSKLSSGREELERLITTNRLKNERDAYELQQAQKEWESFVTYGEEQMLEGKRLSIVQQVQAQANREDELAQLEKMYQGSQIANDTKEIVLERARREIATSRQLLELSKKSEQQTKEYNHPSIKEKLQRDIDKQRTDLELQRVNFARTELQKRDDLSAQERALRDSKELLARLEHDATLLTITAPFSGILRHNGLEIGDRISSHTIFGDIADVSTYELRFRLSLLDLAFVRVNDRVDIRFPDCPQLTATAEVFEIALTPLVDAQEAKYMVKTHVAAQSPLRLGTKTCVDIHGPTLTNVLSVPRTAVSLEDGRNWCRTLSGSTVTRREVTLGAGNRDSVQIIRGLHAGDVVILKGAAK